MKRLLLTTAVIAVISLCSGCAEFDKITQTSTIDALLDGVYDGDMTCGELLRNGDFGIGTFDGLDGEMIVRGGKVYQIKSDGKVYRPALNTKTPFATVCNFRLDSEFAIPATDYEGVKAVIDKKNSNQNVFVAIEITGTFKYIKTRSVPAQQKPYQPLAEIAKKQPTFEMTNINGTIVGFRSPGFVKGINVPGYHFHFLSDDLTRGGHVLDFEIDSGNCKIDICNKFLLILPTDDKLKNIDLTRDKSAELKTVEMGK